MASTETKIPSNPGILWVASTVLHPNRLNPHDFVDWYENTHIQEVQSTGGISGSQRYESLAFHKQERDSSVKDDTPNEKLDFSFLTVYNMPDLAFRESAAFRGLDGQSKPSEQLLDKLFKQAAFVTRFAEEVEPEERNGKTAEYLVSVGFSSKTNADGVLAKVAKLDGCRKPRRFVVRENSALSEYNRSFEEEPQTLALLELDDPSAVKNVRTALDGTGFTDVGFWRLRRDYKGTERTPAGWKPK